MKVSAIATRLLAVVADFPAYSVVSLPEEVHYKHGNQMAIRLQANNELALKTDNARTCWTRHYSICSIVSYVLENGGDPIARVEHAKARGQSMHWINSIGAVITAHKREKEAFIAVEIGQQVVFEGVLFKIVKEPNANLGLERIS